VVATSHDLGAALKEGDISWEQATHIAAAEESCPGVAAELVAVAQDRPFHVLKERARKTKLEAEQHRDLGARQRAARSARSWGDELGMVHIHMTLEPHIGTPIVARAEAEAERIAKDAFLSGVFYDGVDLRHFARWSRTIPVEVRVALELGEPPSFDGVACVDCGRRFGTQFDHLEPHVVFGPASTTNLAPRCWSCHGAKTACDRRAGKLVPPGVTTSGQVRPPGVSRWGPTPRGTSPVTPRENKRENKRDRRGGRAKPPEP
jgi:hypothetical protein